MQKAIDEMSSPSLIIDLQLNQGSAPWTLLRDAAIAAEEAGFSTLWNLDHFSGDMFRTESMLECFTSLAAWAEATSTIQLGTLVTNVTNRAPGLLANTVSTVQEISGNRMILGVGAGAAPTSPWGAEQRALGIEMAPTMALRHERLVNTVETMRSIWATDRDTKFSGFPTPAVAPRIIAGVNSFALAEIAGKHLNGVNIRFNHEQREEVLHVAIAANGGKSGFDVSVWSPFVAEYADPDHAFHKELLAEGVTRLILFQSDATNVEAISSARKYLS